MLYPFQVSAGQSRLGLKERLVGINIKLVNSVINVVYCILQCISRLHKLEKNLSKSKSQLTVYVKYKYKIWIYSKSINKATLLVPDFTKDS